MKGAISLLAGSMIAGLIGGVLLREPSAGKPSSPAIAGWAPRNTIVREPVMSADDLDRQQPDAAAVRTLRPSAGRAPRVAATPTGAYRNCREAWAADAAPLYAGQPGYGAHMDGDHDGIACEPFRR
jgi:hypothetical protein